MGEDLHIDIDYQTQPLPKHKQSQLNVFISQNKVEELVTKAKDYINAGDVLIYPSHKVVLNKTY